jgi:NADH-quinone oxidoreductase subunit L
VYRGELEHAGIDFAIAIPATLAGLSGIGFAWMLYGRASEAPARVAAALGGLYRTVYNKFYFDEIYLFVTHKIIFRFISRPLNWFDRRIVDGTMDLAAQASRLGGAWLRLTASGRVQNALRFVAAGAAGLMLTLIFAGPAVAGLVAAGYAGIGAVLGVQIVRNVRGRGEPLKNIPRD